ncbi:MAG: hypothetical protein RMN25_14015 [Anaerolineae bacterium]|nr:hypothetical protein [Thermoflexales bacterium]MDW8408887.1 hypothetical protein [Anaerolineae bacterium]
MGREVFFNRRLESGAEVQAAINYDEAAFGRCVGAVTPWTVAISSEGVDLGRLVGYEGDAQTILAMHHLKPDPSAKRGFEITVFRVRETVRTTRLDVHIFTALERWLLKRGWRGSIVKLLKHTDPQQVIPVRTFWVKTLGFELILAEEGRWDEHVVKRWR